MDIKMQISIALVLSAICVMLADSAVTTDHNNKANSIDNTYNNCALKLYRAQKFQGKAFMIKESRRRLRGIEKSLQTVGDCCWALYTHRHFKGRPMFLGGRLELDSTFKWGFRRHGIRSVRKLDKSCSF